MFLPGQVTSLSLKVGSRLGGTNFSHINAEDEMKDGRWNMIGKRALKD